MKNNEKFTEKAESAIEQARLAAFSLGHSYVGTEHLLLGIVHEGAGLGARILRERGVSERRLREIISDTAGLGAPGTPAQGLTKHAWSAIEKAAGDLNIDNMQIYTDTELMALLESGGEGE